MLPNHYWNCSPDTSHSREGHLSSHLQPKKNFTSLFTKKKKPEHCYKSNSLNSPKESVILENVSPFFGQS